MQWPNRCLTSTIWAVVRLTLKIFDLTWHNRLYDPEDKMQWPEVRNAYPDQWLVIEALEAHTTSDRQRILDRLAVVDRCPDGAAAFQAYRRLHQQYPQREFYSSTPATKSWNRGAPWLGIRRAMKLSLRHNLPFLTVAVAYQGASS